MGLCSSAARFRLRALFQISLLTSPPRLRGDCPKISAMRSAATDRFLTISDIGRCLCNSTGSITRNKIHPDPLSLTQPVNRVKQPMERKPSEDCAGFS